ncbi:MAG: uncharacterized protein OJF47_002839 [Nitrospira sp.]|jgi:uncharacterized protein YbgA (DUF1722 family)/uncharacterized protein YbbK (DUF523 family)|nr:MAG: uncharacterized protein OJF47_002839 [Nitrospira sp.]
MTAALLRLGISRCLLGDEVRFDGGHKRDGFLTDVLGRYVEWVPVCPEVEAGLGTPREAMRLVGDARHPRLLTIKTGRDQTEAIEAMMASRLPELEALDLSGYVFKKDSPSCGIEGVRLDNRHGMPSHQGIGLFARAFMERFPLIPVEEEGRLCDPLLRENFIERVFCYRRWSDLLQNGVTKHDLLRFHTIHTHVLLSHSPQQYRLLGRLVVEDRRSRSKDLAFRYGELFMKALTVKATVRKHVNVLHHLLGYFKDRLGRQEKDELLGVIEEYHRGVTPLLVPVTMIKHYVRLFGVAAVDDQVYLNPYPKELLLRNHV